MNRLKRTQFWGEDENDDRLIGQILTGQKTATASPANSYFESNGDYDDGGYEVDELVEVYDLVGKLRCIIRITEVYQTPFAIIPEKLYKQECNSSAEEFQQEHIECWPEYDLTDDFYLPLITFSWLRLLTNKFN